MHHVLSHFQNIARGCFMNTLPAGLQAICWKGLCKYLLFLLLFTRGRVVGVGAGGHLHPHGRPNRLLGPNLLGVEVGCSVNCLLTVLVS